MNPNDPVVSIQKGRCSRLNQHGPYLVDESLSLVECGTCKRELNPMFVLKALAESDSALAFRMNSLRKTVEKYEARLRCKCQHCGKMTRISK